MNISDNVAIFLFFWP